MKGSKSIRRVLAVVGATNHPCFVDPDERRNVDEMVELRRSVRLIDQARMRRTRSFNVRADIFRSVESDGDGNETFGAKFFI